MSLETMMHSGGWVTDREQTQVLALVPPAEVPDLGIHLTDDELTNPAIVANTFEWQHYVRRAPTFAEQVLDAGRTNTYVGTIGVVRDRNSSHWGDDILAEMTEHEGLRRLHWLLGKVAVMETPPEVANWDYFHDVAESMQKNLSFIGEKELDEATAGLAALWKSYLDADKRNRLTVLTAVTTQSMRKYRKSDEYIRDRVLDHFTDEELEKYKGRILADFDRNGDPEHTKIIIVDDWVISGGQVRLSYGSLKRSYPEFAAGMEVNLVIAHPDIIRRGMDLAHSQDRAYAVPVKAFYAAHPVDPLITLYGAHITGTHSTADYGFGTEIYNIYDGTKAKPGMADMQTLAHVKRAYREGMSWYGTNSDHSIVRLEHRVEHQERFGGGES